MMIILLFIEVLMALSATFIIGFVLGRVQMRREICSGRETWLSR